MEPDTASIRAIPGILRSGWDDYTAAWRAHSWMAVVVLGVYAAARLGASFFLATDRTVSAFLVDLGGLIVATAIALPWFTLSLAVARQRHAGFERSWAESQGSFVAMAIAASAFWLVVVFGVVYALGIPSLIVLVLFGLFGFAVANERLTGLRSLRHAYRVGRGQRTLIAAVALLLLIANGAIASALGSGPVLVLVALPLLVMSTGFSMSTGAHLYLLLLGAQSPPE